MSRIIFVEVLCFLSFKDVTMAIDIFTQYNSLWQKDRDEELKDFLATDPCVSEFENQIKSYQSLELSIHSQPEYIHIGPLAIYTGIHNRINIDKICYFSRLEYIKLSFQHEIREWINVYVHSCNMKYRQDLNEWIEFIDDIDKRLSRKIEDLEDIRLVMIAVKALRENEINIDMKITPIEECYALLQAYGRKISPEEIERSDTLRYRWQKLQHRCVRNFTYIGYSIHRWNVLFSRMI